MISDRQRSTITTGPQPLSGFCQGQGSAFAVRVACGFSDHRTCPWATHFPKSGLAAKPVSCSCPVHMLQSLWHVQDWLTRDRGHSGREHRHRLNLRCTHATPITSPKIKLKKKKKTLWPPVHFINCFHLLRSSREPPAQTSPGSETKILSKASWYVVYSTRHSKETCRFQNELTWRVNIQIKSTAQTFISRCYST